MNNKQKVFDNAASLKAFLIGNKAAEDWVNDNHEQFGLRRRVDQSRISRALSGVPVATEIVDALEALHDQIWRDPFAWIMLPDDIESLASFAPLSWWHEVLQPDVPLNTWNVLNKRPLNEKRAEEVLLDLRAFNDRTKEICEEHMRDVGLVEALWADKEPEYEFWCMGDEPWRNEDRAGTNPDWTPKQIRVAPFGMHNILKDAMDTTDSQGLVELAARTP